MHQFRLLNQHRYLDDALRRFVHHLHARNLCSTLLVLLWWCMCIHLWQVYGKYCLFLWRCVYICRRSMVNTACSCGDVYICGRSMVNTACSCGDVYNICREVSRQLCIWFLSQLPHLRFKLFLMNFFSSHDCSPWIFFAVSSIHYSP